MFNLTPHSILWHIDPLIDNDRETNNETMTVAKQRPARNKGSTLGSVVSMWSAPRRYHATDRVQCVSAVELSEVK
jgi:hypothetical protein